VDWNGDLDASRRALAAAGLEAAVPHAMDNLRQAETEAHRILACGTPTAKPGCAVTVRYIFQVTRTAALGAVLAQMVTGFTLANTAGTNVVALNLVAPEDDPAAMRNFTVEMQMLHGLRPLFPHAHLTLHAGELVPGLVPPEGLDFHIRESVEIAGAERIGHGVDLLHEDDPVRLLREMAERQVMVEICLTSNDAILGVKGANHPLATYLKYGVPVALATDDEGVSRSEMSLEYMKAATDQHLGYLELKQLARTSLEHAFVGGASLWRDGARFVPVAACAGDLVASGSPSPACQQLLATSDRARLEWHLERDFQAFERTF